MEENYLTRSKIHTKALAVTMAMMEENGKADLMNYHDILHHWYKWIHINAPFYENLNYSSQGEHMEVTLAKLRTTFPAYTSYAKSLLNDLETIITLYNGNKDFFASLYKDRAILRRKMEAHLMEEGKKYKPEGETVNRRSKIDNELEVILCDYRHIRKFRAKLQELEDKYSITIDPDNTQRWFAKSQEIYKAYNERYDAFDEYKSVCRTAFCDNYYIESTALTAEKVYKVLVKEIMDNENPFVPSCQPAADLYTELNTESDVETKSAVKIYLNEDTCQSFYRSGAVGYFFKTSKCPVGIRGLRKTPSDRAGISWQEGAAGEEEKPYQRSERTLGTLHVFNIYSRCRIDSELESLMHTERIHRLSEHMHGYNRRKWREQESAGIPMLDGKKSNPISASRVSGLVFNKKCR